MVDGQSDDFATLLNASQDLSSAAWMASIKDDNETALRLYSQAADAAGKAFAFLGHAKNKTFNVVLLHWAALLQKSGRFEEAKSVCGEYLMYGDDFAVSARTRRELAVVYGLAFWRINCVGETAE